MNFTWEAFVLIIVGVILLRISGRKSIALMTSTQTVVMISIGTIIVQPIIENRSGDFYNDTYPYGIASDSIQFY
ncbi:hypothetical protein ABR330_20080 [Bacillus cabrialesii subsp. cabrialesii]|uniref:hypothetical protein n=1 Tax=Bacillus cabrialesii TaxID=2487276 RepID=UPI003305B9FE